MAVINTDKNPMIMQTGTDLVNSRSRLYLNNLFYTIVPSRFYLLYLQYIRPALEAFDGVIPGFHDYSVGRVPQGLTHSIAQGTKQLIFKKPVSFNVESDISYDWFKDWSEKTNFNETLKQAWINCCAGPAALLRLNEDSKGLPWIDTLRIDHFFVDTDNRKKIMRAVMYIDSFEGISLKNNKVAYSLVEERYFDSEGIPRREYNYYQAPSLININLPPRVDAVNKVDFKSLPNHIQNKHEKSYGNIMLGIPMRLPYHNHLGVALMRFTESIPGYESLPLGRPLSDIILHDSCQYDLSKQFGTLESYVAMPRIMVPTPYRKPGEGQTAHSLDGFVYVKYDVTNTDGTKPEALQFDFRSDKNDLWRDSILKDVSMKINIAPSAIAPWIQSTTSNTTATAIISSKDKTDMFISDKAKFITSPVNELLKLIAFRHAMDAPLLELHPQSIIDPATKIEVYSKELDLGHITPEFFVRTCYDDLDRKSQREMVNYIKEQQIAKMQPMGVLNG